MKKTEKFIKSKIGGAKYLKITCYVLACVLLTIITFYILNIWYFNNLENQILEQQTNITTTSELISIYLQEQNGDYVYSSSSSFSTEGYILNEEKSYCINESTLSWSGTQITVTTKGPDNCYLYFDELPLLLYEQILMNEEDGDGNTFSSVDDATTYIKSKTTPTFSSAATTDEGIFETTDTDGGSSYYFRGAVDDNWVYYAGCYWRIIRIDEDGNVRMIYSGTIQPTESQAVVMIGTQTRLSSTSTSYNGDDSVYVTDANGSSYLMYKTLLGAQYVYTTGELHGDDNSSVIKGVVDTWFTTTIKSNEEYYQYIASTTYCNDRTYYTSYSNTGTSVEGDYFYEYTSTTRYYGAYYRIKTYYTPTLDCTNSLDELELEVALITVDEAMFAGGKYGTNTSYYLYTSSTYWTLSPSYLYSTYASVFYVNYSGSLSSTYVYSTSGVRPVVSLNSEISDFSGSGTWDDPYVIG